MVRPNAPQVQARSVREVFRSGNPGFWAHPEWEANFPWLVQGTTGKDRSKDQGPWDFAFFGESSSPGARDRWENLGSALGFDTIVHSQQIHDTGVLNHGFGVPPRGAGVRARDARPGSFHGAMEGGLGRDPRDPSLIEGAALVLGPDADGHISGADGVLLGITIADCIPVFLVDPEIRVVGLLHAGWRGAVAGILEKGIGRLQTAFGVRPEHLHVHLGPGICRDCFEVGPEVHRAMGLPDPGEPQPVDLRGHLAGRGVAAGVDLDRTTESAWCTRCDESPFFSHRRGEGGRQVGFLGLRARGDPSAPNAGVSR